MFTLKNLLIGFAILTLMPIKMNAEWVSLNKNNSSQTPPVVTLLKDNAISTVIKIDISGFDLKEFNTEGKTYQSIDLLSEIFSAKPGYPELPYIAKVLAIPDQAGISVEVIEMGEVQTFSNIHIQPTRESWLEGQPETPYLENGKAYQSTGVFPQDYTSIDPPAIFRDFRIARISVFPLRYIASKNELQAVSSITVRINYGPGEVVNPKTTAKKAIAPSFAKIYESFIFNYKSVLDKQYGGKEEGHELMLCIMPDEFFNSFQVYADWKRESGTDIHITKFSNIGANSSDPNIIKDHISDAYHNWEVPPTYILIIGDDGVFPTKIVSYDYSFPNEDFFVEIDGDDYFPEMMIGRFTNQGDYRMQVMINKFMLYEKEPYVEDTDWFKKGVCCSNNEFESQVNTKRFTAKCMRENGGFTVDTLMSDGYWGSGCSMNLNDVLNTINEGRSYLNYRGEGWYDGWHANCYEFSPSDVSSLTNGEKFTFVTSIGCGVAMFDTYGGNCFGETWVQLGSLTSPRGGVAFVGPTSNTHTTYNNKIDKGIYVGMFQEGMDTPGQALLRGKLYMYNVFGTAYWTEYQYRVYCVLGDPSIHIWKDVPLAVNIDYPSSIVVGNNQLEITTTFAASGLAVADAEICITGENVFVTGICDTNGKVIMDFAPEIPEALTITVRGGNVIPYQGTINVSQPGQYVQPDPEPLVVDIDGNIDGLVNPNENCTIAFTLKNWGTQTANNVQATISAANTDYVDIISTDPISFGNLTPGSEYTGDPFQFFVKPNCTVGQNITLLLNVTSNTGSWDYEFVTQIHGCELMINNFLVNDENSPNPNYKMDAGETVKLVFAIDNFGDDIASDVMAVLTSNDQYISIDNPNGSFGPIGINEVAINQDDFFIVSIDASCPAGYLAGFSLELNTQNGNYSYQVISDFSLPVTLPVLTDYTGPDDYGYYAYSNNDAFYDQTPVYNWIEIKDIGTEINVPYNNSDYTQTVGIPFSFKYYGLDYTQLRISTDGWLAFGGGSQTAPVNSALPTNDNVNCMVGVFWDDLYDLDLTQEGEILYYNDNVNHRFIIEWDSIALNIDGIEPVKEIFQAILLDPAFYPTTSEDGEIILQYKRIEGEESMTVGIENNLQDIGLQYVYNNDYDATASVVEGGIAIKFTTEPPNFDLITGTGDDDNFQNGLSLGQNQPNPFKSTTWINYSLPETGNVFLAIYNVDGELVRTLQNGQQNPGKYSVMWNGLNDSQNKVTPGIYFYRLQVGNHIKTLKMLKFK
jgi:hypothetical protein